MRWSPATTGLRSCCAAPCRTSPSSARPSWPSPRPPGWRGRQPASTPSPTSSSAACSPSVPSTSSTSTWRPTTGPGSRAPRSAATGTTSSSSAPGAPRFVVGDVMGRGVTAAAGMGQLRSAVRAFAKLDLPPAEVLEYLDGIVQDLRGRPDRHLRVRRLRLHRPDAELRQRRAPAAAPHLGPTVRPRGSAPPVRRSAPATSGRPPSTCSSTSAARSRSTPTAWSSGGTATSTSASRRCRAAAGQARLGAVGAAARDRRRHAAPGRAPTTTSRSSWPGSTRSRSSRRAPPARPATTGGGQRAAGRSPHTSASGECRRRPSTRSC